MEMGSFFSKNPYLLLKIFNNCEKMSYYKNPGRCFGYNSIIAFLQSMISSNSFGWITLVMGVNMLLLVVVLPKHNSKMWDQVENLGRSFVFGNR